MIAQLDGLGQIFQHLFGVSGDEDGSGDGVQEFEAIFEGTSDDSMSIHSVLSKDSSDSEAGVVERCH